MLDPNADLSTFVDRFSRIVSEEWDARYNKKFNSKRKLKPWISVPTPAWDNDSKAVVNHSKIGEMPCINLLLLNKSGLT